MKRLGLLILVFVLPVRVCVAHAATGDGSGSVGSGGQITVGVTVQTPGSDTPVDVNGHGSTQPIVWTVIKVPARLGDLSGMCAAGYRADGQPILGTVFHLTGHTLDGTLVPDRMICVPLAQPGNEQPVPPKPPVLPTIEEVWRHTQLPQPSIGLDPATRGITGLDTRIWTETATTVSISASIDGYTIVGTATVIGYTVQVDNGPVSLVDHAGSATNPVAHHIFETKGKHTVRIGVVWHGTATFSGPALGEAIATPIGNATITSERPYQVDEIRSVLVE